LFRRPRRRAIEDRSIGIQHRRCQTVKALTDNAGVLNLANKANAC
jgi:hypothetical protein